MHPVCLSVPELSSAEYVLNSKQKLHVVHVSPPNAKFGRLQRTAKNCTKFYNARSEPLYC